VPTQVRISPVKGKAVLISGHDMTNLEALLKQTEGKVCCAAAALHMCLV
jgi:hydroxylamine reductase